MGYNEYAEDAWLYQDSYDYDEEEDEVDDKPMDQETWYDEHDNDLLNMWMSICEYRDMFYLRDKVMKHASFASFCDWAYKNS